MGKLFVISLGGSLIVPNEIDINFLNKFKEVIIKEIQKGKRFIIIVGGGKIAREYQTIAKQLSNPSNEDLDWLGIYSTRLNAHLLLTIFREYSHFRFAKNPRKKFDFKEKILIAAGWKPGFSTDYDAVLLAKTYGSNTIINLTNIDYVYDKDPRKYKDAKPFRKLSWDDYLKIIEKDWKPGMSSPFDPVASRLAKKLKFKVYILNGKNLSNFIKCIEGKQFIGTLIF